MSRSLHRTSSFLQSFKCKVPFFTSKRSIMGSIQAPKVAARVLIIGGSYGGLAAALNLVGLCNGSAARSAGPEQNPKPTLSEAVPIEVKIIDERDGFYHVIGSPLALASSNYASKAWKKYDSIPVLKTLGIKYQQGTVMSVDFGKRIATVTNISNGSEEEESYDYLVVSTGLRRVWPVVPQALTEKEYLVEAGGHIQAVTDAREVIVVIGGGAVGIEMAAELKLTEPTKTVKLIHSRDKLLSSEPLPDEVRDKSLELLQETGVEVVLGQRVTEVVSEPVEKQSSYDLTLSDGSHLKAGHVISAISNGVPSTTFLEGQALDDRGYVKINSNLNILSIPNSSSHFAIGDISSWSGIKRCGGAMSMGHKAAVNIHQQILQSRFGTKPEFLEYPEVPPMIIMAVGKQAVLYGPEGMKFGKEIMEMCFGDDLWLSRFWDYMKLDEGEEKEKMTEGKI